MKEICVLIMFCCLLSCNQGNKQDKKLQLNLAKEQNKELLLQQQFDSLYAEIDSIATIKTYKEVIPIIKLAIPGFRNDSAMNFKLQTDLAHYYLLEKLIENDQESFQKSKGIIDSLLNDDRYSTLFEFKFELPSGVLEEFKYEWRNTKDDSEIEILLIKSLIEEFKDYKH